MNNNDIKAIMTLIILVAVGCSFYFIGQMPRSVYSKEEYEGTLEAVSYDHLGWFGGVSGTRLYFIDGMEFQLEGDYDFALGKVYTITYEDHGNYLKVLSVKLKESS